MTENNFALVATDLKKYYPSVKAVDGVSIELKKGEIISILGPNGAGKTTTVEMLEGLRKPDSGRIVYFEKYEKITNEVKERIGVCLQENFFFEELTVFETIRLHASLYNTKADFEEIIDTFQLGEKLKARTKYLSGGQKQRLAVALAFLNNPDIVFLDEPTVGLDPQARRHLWDVILKYKREGKSIILTTHYMEEAHQLSDRVYIMDHGKVIAHGTPQELISSSGLNSVIEFPKQYAEKINLEGMIITGEYAYVSVTDPVPIIEKLLKANVRNFVLRHPTLEDVFLKLTGRKID
ncbi:ABC transporter ATP-binding protein [Fervidobacterium ngatamarikiense]|uniref:ABC transporter ATP-binding protein n=1 Tax=Fervidobacterium pennivorans TaxID=93466 RepID=A0A172T1Q0_FERPE|nr:ABC transporter ATP-binding protein [Fervidobacterium pennivorans]ANE40935.1 ABC transporter ATP-binding protein [Fervidobacterium pennivorans]